MKSAKRDNRVKTKMCSVCGIRTVMGISENTPQRARERWNGKEYLRYCGPECEKSFFAGVSGK